MREEPGLWRRPSEGTSLTPRDVASDVIEDALETDELSDPERLALAFGLLDELDVYTVAMYLGFEFAGPHAAHASDTSMVWEFCEQVLERPDESTAVPYWLWVDWFEDERYSDEAWVRLIQGIHDTRLTGPRLRRVDRVLRISGPVRWETKRDALQYAVQHRQLHSALLWAIQGAVEDEFGRVVETEARELLKRLRLQGGEADLRSRLLAALQPEQPRKNGSRRRR